MLQIGAEEFRILNHLSATKNLLCKGDPTVHHTAYSTEFIRRSNTGVPRVCLGRLLFQKLHRSPFRYATFRLAISGPDAANRSTRESDFSAPIGIVFHRHRGALILGYTAQGRPARKLAPTEFLQSAHRQAVDAQRVVRRRVERCDRGKHGNILIGLGVIMLDSHLPDTGPRQVPRELLISRKDLHNLPERLFALYDFFGPEHTATSMIPGNQLLNIVARCMTPAERFVRDNHWARFDTTWPTHIRTPWSA